MLLAEKISAVIIQSLLKVFPALVAYWRLRNNTAQYSAIQHSTTIQRNTTQQYNTVQHNNTTQYNTIQQYTSTQHYNTTQYNACNTIQLYCPHG